MLTTQQALMLRLDALRRRLTNVWGDGCIDSHNVSSSRPSVWGLVMVSQPPTVGCTGCDRTSDQWNLLILERTNSQTVEKVESYQLIVLKEVVG